VGVGRREDHLFTLHLWSTSIENLHKALAPFISYVPIYRKVMEHACSIIITPVTYRTFWSCAQDLLNIISLSATWNSGRSLQLWLTFCRWGGCSPRGQVNLSKVRISTAIWKHPIPMSESKPTPHLVFEDVFLSHILPTSTLASA
jgi:hypothetical protein